MITYVSKEKYLNSTHNRFLMAEEKNNLEVLLTFYKMKGPSWLSDKVFYS